MKEEQLKLCSVLDHDTEPIQEKAREKVSQKDKKKRGDLIADKAKDGVEKILKNIQRKDTNPLNKLRIKNWK